jgi:hypothetical protein
MGVIWVVFSFPFVLKEIAMFDTGIVINGQGGDVTLYSRRICKNGVQVAFSFYDTYYFVSNGDRMPGMYVTRNGQTEQVDMKDHDLHMAITHLENYLDES